MQIWPDCIPCILKMSLGIASAESKTLIETSDLILSKGGGNHDSLTEEKELKGKTSFLFLAKCYPY